MNLRGTRVLIVAAGTGGHILPGIQIGHHLESLGASVRFVCGTRAIERRIYAGAGITPAVIPWPGAPKSIGERLVRIGTIGAAIPRAAALLRAVRPDAVLSMGGGFSAPILALARLAGTPTFLHESNAVPGRVTRLFAGGAKAVFLGLPTTCALRNAIVCGTPCRAIPPRAETPQPSLLVLGGSQGATKLNRTALDAFRILRTEFPALRMTVLAASNPAPPDLPNGVDWFPYLDDPGPSIAGAHICVSRSGAGTLAELAAAGAPSVLVPYPFAKDNHQEANARLFAQAGAAVVIPEGAITAESLAEALRPLLANRDARERASVAARSLHRPDSLERIAAGIARGLRRKPLDAPTPLAQQGTRA